MTQYVLTDGKDNVLKYPYNVGMLRRDNPNTSFPSRVPEALLGHFNVLPIEEVVPEYDKDAQYLTKDQQPTVEIIESQVDEEVLVSPETQTYEYPEGADEFAEPIITTIPAVYETVTKTVVEYKWSIGYTVNEIPTDQIRSQNETILRTQKDLINKAFDEDSVSTVVDGNGLIWRGGEASAMSIKGAIDLAAAGGLTEITLRDSSYAPHVMTLEEATLVAATIGLDYQTKFQKKEDLKMQLSQIDLSLPTAKDLIQAITYEV